MDEVGGGGGGGGGDALKAVGVGGAGETLDVLTLRFGVKGRLGDVCAVVNCNGSTLIERGAGSMIKKMN